MVYCTQTEYSDIVSNMFFYTLKAIIPLLAMKLILQKKWIQGILASAGSVPGQPVQSDSRFVVACGLSFKIQLMN